MIRLIAICRILGVCDGKEGLRSVRVNASEVAF
jgi:hypothetical protein